MKSLEERILDLLDAQGPMGAQRIAKALGMDRSPVDHMLVWLTGTHQLKRITKNGFVFSALPERKPLAKRGR